MILPVTLSSAAAAALICIWLGLRIARLRGQLNISHGDAGNEALIRRMRAQLNFVEYTPFVLLLIAGIELSGKGGLWLAIVAAVYMLGRLAHAFGMDSAEVPQTRKIGTMLTFLTLLGLSIIAVLITARII